MTPVIEIRRALDAASSAHGEILRIAAAFERHVEAEDARIKRRLERIDAREERIIALCERLKAASDEKYSAADVAGLSEEDRYRLLGEGNGMRAAISLIGETYR